MRRSIIKLSIAVLLVVPGALLTMPGCGPRPDSAPQDTGTKPVAPAVVGGTQPAGQGTGSSASASGGTSQPTTAGVAASQPPSPGKAGSAQPAGESSASPGAQLTKAASAGKVAAASRPSAPPEGPWPQFRGPDRTGISHETGLLKQWPAGGPPLLWKATGIGTGNSSPSVAGGRIFGMSNRGNDECVWALQEAGGKPVWNTRIAAANFNIGSQAQDGPGCTPTIVGDHLYAIGASGDLVCLRTNDGKLLWQKNLTRDFGGGVPQWGYSESPLVEGNKVIVTPGGSDATLVALDRMTGAVIWKGKVPQGDGAGYSSAIAVNSGGQRQIIQFLAGGVVGLAADTGKFLWRYDAPANRMGINASAPLFADDQVFAASSYGNGGGMARLVAAPGGGMSATQVYFTRNMRSHHGGMVLVNGYVYGFDESNLTCLDFKTGAVKWYDRSVGKGSVIYADGHIYARSENGPVALVEANPDRYIEKGRFDQPDRSGKTTWPYPVIAAGKLYLRDHDTLLCYNVKAGG